MDSGNAGARQDRSSFQSETAVGRVSGQTRFRSRADPSGWAYVPVDDSEIGNLAWGLAVAAVVHQRPVLARIDLPAAQRDR